MKRIALLVFAVLALASCATFDNLFSLFDEDESLPPTPLMAVEQRVAVTTLWTVRTGAGSDEPFVRLHPALSDGKIFTADGKGQLSAWDAGSGKPLWTVDSDVAIAGGIGASKDLVVIGTHDAKVLAFSAADGRRLWQAVVSSEVLSAPGVGSDTVAVHTVDSRLFGLEAASGKRRWVYERSAPVLSLRGNSSPLLIDNRVIIGLDNGKLVALNAASGKLVWEASVAVPSGRSELDRMVDIDADPQLHNGYIYAVSFQGRIAAVAAESGRIEWARAMSAFAGLSVDEDQLYVTDEQSQVFALAQSNGASVWKQDKLRGRRLTAPVVFGDYVVVADFEGYVHWLSRSDGQFVARVRTDDAAVHVAPVAAQDRLYVLNKDGHLTAYGMPDAPGSAE